MAEADWEALYHAYGSASDVPVLLSAVTVGDDSTRAADWWQLWGNIHHQGSEYEATPPAVAPLIALATWKAYPDRVRAPRMVRQAAGSDNIRICHYGADGENVHDEHAAVRSAARCSTRCSGTPTSSLAAGGSRRRCGERSCGC